MIALYCLLGIVLYYLLGFLFYRVALSIYARFGIDDLIATVWFNGGKVGAILLWPIWFGLWFMHCILALVFGILATPIYLTGEDSYTLNWIKEYPKWVEKAKTTGRWEGAPLWEKIAACRWCDDHSGESWH